MYRLLPDTEPTVPAFYGLPKIHKKEPIPVRPIVSSIGSVTYDIAKYVAQILGPLVGKTEHHVLNSQDFFGKISSVKIEEGESVESLDVVGLFTCIPPRDAVDISRSCLEKDNTLDSRTPLSVDQVCDLLALCLNTTYFSFDNKFYLQVHGCAMGSPVSPIVVNLYMEAFEQRALSEFVGIAPRVWYRYVDDIWNLNKEDQHNEFFGKVNTLDPNLKFTREKANDQKELPYLDSLTKAEEDGSVSSKVYRKPTHTDQYLQFESHHPLVHKLGVIRTLFHRADTIVTEYDDVRQEKAHVKSALRRCGYPRWSFHNALNVKDKPPAEPSAAATAPGRRQVRINLPYVGGMSERLRRHFASFNICASLKPFNQLRGQLVNVKDRMPRDKRSNVVYGYKCPADNCTETYIGETKQAFQSRMAQHRRPAYRDQLDSAIYKHISTSGHSFENTDVQILDKEVRWHERGVKESIYERIEKPTLTTKLRFNLSHVWDPALRTVSSHLSDAKQSSQSQQTHPSHQQADGNSSVRGSAVVQHAS